MPFRFANEFGGYDYPAFTPTGGTFDFTSYDPIADPSMSPYDAFPLSNPSEVAWTPISQDPESQHSDSLSPAELNFATSTNVSPLSQGESDPRPLPGSAPSPSTSTATSVRNRDTRYGYTASQQPTSQHQMASISSSSAQIWPGASNSISTASMPQVVKSSDSASPPEVLPVAAPVRHNSTDDSSETSDTNRPRADRSEPSRTRATDSAKVRHNIVERRYRENINAQVDVLRDSIVATMEAKSSRLGADELKRLTKAAVIAAATQQIKRARSENDKLLDEHRDLQAQIKELEKLVKCGECPLMQLSVDMHLESPSQTA